MNVQEETKESMISASKSTKTIIKSAKKLPFQVFIRSNGVGFSTEAREEFKKRKEPESQKHKYLDKLMTVFAKYDKIVLTGVDANIIKTINTVEKLKRECKSKFGHKVTQITHVKEIQVQKTKKDSDKGIDDMVPIIEITLTKDQC
ncbi:unnamed protein product [Moneuplotes crassus]|uniref:DNA/RNA-binding protein Alba-like domain-containing protein n=1 Tax=Euplotes crassus TaxID=5936 RepID=A0AAD1Y289_EUPCR|nr:unnamed protein product [Moneuplotes crassus]